MSTITTLASGQITSIDALIVVLAEPDGMPTSVIIHWPSQPTVLDPRAFSPVADTAAKTLAAALVRLAQIRRSRRL